tara:strand:+ start:81 stop:437 length:357 start_codon:yes stop_codon:yes gene_type:complete
MKPHEVFISFKTFLRLGLTGLALSMFGFSPVVAPVRAQPNGKSDIPKEREIHNTFSDTQDKGTILDATNPLDLLNRLRQATAMDDATTPSDAIDEALKVFDYESSKSNTLKTGIEASK